jgi:hypothetical protein
MTENKRRVVMLLGAIGGGAMGLLIGRLMEKAPPVWAVAFSVLVCAALIVYSIRSLREMREKTRELDERMDDWTRRRRESGLDDYYRKKHEEAMKEIDDELP